jgi:RNA polymerase sigma-70 factor (ECF subfamily)
MNRRQGKSDRELLKASRAGKGGFEEFYCRHRHSVLAFHARRVREPEAAADLAAETFAAALLMVHDRDREIPEAPLAWLFTIAHRKLVDSYRRGRVEAQARERLAFQPMALDDDDLEHIADVADGVDLLATLERQLPAAQFAALRARVLDEREYADIAAELECSEQVIRMRVSRALKTLRAASEAHHD